MKNRTKLPNIYIGVVTAVLYLPIVLVIIYSFNESKISSVWGGFSLKWYETLFRDAAMFEALGNSIVLALCASLGAAVIGTLGAYGFTKVQLRTKSAVEYVSMLPIMIPEIILGMVFMAFFSLLGLPFGMTTLILAHTVFCVPYVYMLVKARLVGMDKSLAEAARDLGAGEEPVRRLAERGADKGRRAAAPARAGQRLARDVAPADARAPLPCPAGQQAEAGPRRRLPQEQVQRAAQRRQPLRPALRVARGAAEHRILRHARGSKISERLSRILAAISGWFMV